METMEQQKGNQTFEGRWLKDLFVNKLQQFDDISLEMHSCLWKSIWVEYGSTNGSITMAKIFMASFLQMSYYNQWTNNTHGVCT